MIKNVYEPKVGDKVRVLVERSYHGTKLDVTVPYIVVDRNLPIIKIKREDNDLMGSDRTSSTAAVWGGDIVLWEPQQSSGAYESLGTQIGALVDEKQRQYGNSFGKCGDFLRILYPDGIAPDAYGDMLALVRIFDKQVRIANGGHGDNESPYRDIAGYGLLGEMEAVKKGAPE